MRFAKKITVFIMPAAVPVHTGMPYCVNFILL